MEVSQADDNYAALHGHFRWRVPQRFNIAEAVCGRWARDPRLASRSAIIEHEVAGEPRHHSFGELQAQADRLSHVLRALGVQPGDRVAIVLPQRFETAVAYIAILQMGAVAMPLSILFGPEALEYRLQDSETAVAICDESSVNALIDVRPRCPALRALLGVGAAALRADFDFAHLLSLHPPGFRARDTLADESAVLIYTSGTTGPPKGSVTPHRALLGNLAGFVASQNWFGFDASGRGESQAVFWSPADWAWTGGLMDALLPTLYFGRPIVAFNGRFSPELAFSLIEQHGVTHSFLFPTALKAMMKAFPAPRSQFRLALQAIMSAGEAVGDAVFAYCREQLGVTVNEMFGQTEINYIVGNCAMEWADGPGEPVRARRDAGVGWPARAGSMGKPYPGHRVAVIDEQGRECPVGVPGDVAVHRLNIHGEPDPVFFLGYWKNAQATRDKYLGEWCRTGDLATRDADGYLWYQGRADDLFKAAGYRIGPSEIENCLVKHAAVANAAVVPKPDADRGALVKAYVVLATAHRAQRAQAQQQGATALHGFDARLVAELQAHVKGQLAPYEYPKEIEFIDALPMTTTGKVQRRVLRLQEEERARLRA